MTVADELPRIEALLRLQRYDQVSTIEAEPSATDVGAEGAVAYEWAAPPVRASVYVFADMSSAIAAEAELHRALDHASVRTVSGLNGGLLLWGMTLADDAAGVALLDELAESFAGEE